MRIIYGIFYDKTDNPNHHNYQKDKKKQSLSRIIADVLTDQT